MSGHSDPPAPIGQRAADLLKGRLEVVPLRDAATVALLRDGPQGLEVFMQRRAGALAFASGVYVFPGGRVEEQDTDPRVPFCGTAPHPPPFDVGGDIVLGVPAPRGGAQSYRALIAAAVRETVEEAGVLLAQTRTGPVGPDAAVKVRSALLAGVPLAEALRQISAAISFSALVAFAHWMTPAVEIRRFDTRFFAAALPEGQQGHSASGETDDARWVRPALMLERAAAGDVVMLPPTLAALQALAPAPDRRTVLEAGHQPSLRPVLPHPYWEGQDARWRLVDGYTGEPLEPK